MAEKSNVVSGVSGDVSGSQISPSVIRIRIERLRAQAMKDLLLMVIAECGAELNTGAAITVEPGRIRVRSLPLIANN